MSFDCCADPKPRINDGDGTFFCANCRRQLSSSIDEPVTDGHDTTDAEDVGDEEREN